MITFRFAASARLLAAASALAFVTSAPLSAQDSAVVTDEDGQQIVVNGRPAIGSFGVDLSARDLTADPGDDFERYASGSWIDATQIPGDRASVGSFYNLHEDVQANVRELIESGSGTKFGALYASYMDEAAVERAGIAPLMRDIAKVRAIGDKTEFARFMGDTTDSFGASLFGTFVYADTANPTMNALFVGTGGLGLPQKDYYFKPDYAKQRAAYQDYLERTLRTLGHSDAGAKASDVLAFESYLASLSWDAADLRDIGKVNNPMSSTELASYAPGIDWSALFAGAEIPPQERMIVTDNTAIKAFAELYAENQLLAKAVRASIAGGRGQAADSVGPKLEAALLAEQEDQLLQQLSQLGAIADFSKQQPSLHDLYLAAVQHHNQAPESAGSPSKQGVAA